MIDRFLFFSFLFFFEIVNLSVVYSIQFLCIDFSLHLEYEHCFLLDTI